MNNTILVIDFIEQIWNQSAFEKMDHFLHPQFKDYSLPSTLTADKEGTKKWIIGTGIAFEHNTIIEDQVTEGNTSIIRIKMNLKHIGLWRNLEPTGTALHIIGYRQFKLKDGKIIGHWALIDGQTIENTINNTTLGCKIAE